MWGQTSAMEANRVNGPHARLRSEVPARPVAGAYQEERHRRGDVLFWEGDRATHVFHVLEGWVKLVKHGSTGKDTIVAIFGPGEVLGEVSALAGRPYNGTAIVMTRGVVAREPAESFQRKVLEDPAFLRRLVIGLSDRLRDAENMMQRLATERVEKRIATLLVKLAERQKCGDACTLEIPLTRQEIADMVGATIETTIRIFSRFIQEGAIRRGGRKLVLSNLGHLRRAAA